MQPGTRTPPAKEHQEHKEQDTNQPNQTPGPGTPKAIYKLIRSYK